MRRLLNEYRLFLSQPREMRVLLVTNLIYAFVMPVTDLFVATYVMRNSSIEMVVVYQLALYSGIPLMFLLNGWLLQYAQIKRLYAASMLLSGVSMAAMMSLSSLSLMSVGVTGVLMGMSAGLYWSNRNFLRLSSTDDSNRNYYCGLENFFETNIGIVMPVAVGAFIGYFTKRGWVGFDGKHAYQIVACAMLLLTVAASIVVNYGRFENPPKTNFVFFRFHRLWNWMQLLIVLRELVQGYNLAIPAILVLQLVGNEGSLGVIQTCSGVLSAFLLYLIGRTTGPQHRLGILTASVLLIVTGAVASAVGFNKPGVLILMGCMAFARPMQNIAHATIQMGVVDTVSALERRNKYAYVFNQEFGAYIGRFCGCTIFLLLAFKSSGIFALRYAVLIVGVLQLLSIWVARVVVNDRAGLINAGLVSPVEPGFVFEAQEI